MSFCSAVLVEHTGFSMREMLCEYELGWMMLGEYGQNGYASEAAEVCGFGSVKSFYRAKKKFENDGTMKRNNER